MNKFIQYAFVYGCFYAGQILGQVPDSTTSREFLSDPQIRQKVNNTLRSGSFLRKFATVTFEVDRGFVALTGYVDTEEDKNEVEAIVKQLKGVKGVKNDLKTRELPSKFVNPLYPY
jgi:osmotically-inducible protein OsmY